MTEIQRFAAETEQTAQPVSPLALAIRRIGVMGIVVARKCFQDIAAAIGSE